MHTFKLPPRLIGKTSGFLRIGKSGQLIRYDCQKPDQGSASRASRSRPRASGSAKKGKLTLKKGVVKFVLTPKSKGSITFTLSKKGYQTSTVVLKINY